MSIFPQELQAARLRLVKKRPYLSSAAWTLQPIETPGLGTLAVDMWWRLYYDSAVIQRWTVEELAGVLYHEICHLLRDHAGRMKNLNPKLSNIASDAEINDNLLEEGITLPGSPITPNSIGQPKNLLAEEYYAVLEQSASVQGTQPDDNRGDGSKSGDADNSKPGGEAKNNVSSSGQSSASSHQESSSQLSTGPANSHVSGQDSQMQAPMPGAGRCGSCATGQQEPWEEGPPGEGTSHGTSRAEAELIRRDVARQIKEHSQGQGNIPGHWKRWADEKLYSKVNWRRELASAVRHAVADVAGAVDYSYRRPSRRQGQVGNGKIILPSLRRPVPSVAVVVDTSGSMDDEMLSQALAEISGILKGMGQRESVTVLAVDTDVHTCHKVFRPDQVKLAGGGGTDMGAGLEAASKLKPVPQVVVVITDGYTPWPDHAPRGMKVIVVLTDSGKAPDWAKAIEVSN